MSDYETFGFPEAMTRIIEGCRVRRLSWTGDHAHDYGFLHAGLLHISTKGTLHTWLVSDGDLNGDDWVVLRDN